MMPLSIRLLMLFGPCFPVIAQAPLEVSGDPLQTPLITADIDQFWEAYDLAYPWLSADLLDSLYLREGTEGLLACREWWLGDPEKVSQSLQSDWDYYESVRQTTLSIRSQEAQIRAAMCALKYLYPATRFPDIYFVMGRPEALSLALGNRLIINASVFGPLPVQLTRARRAVPPRYSLEFLPQVVLRELVRFQFPEERAPLTLLAFCLREGIADLLSELATGRPFRPDPGRDFLAGEKNLWQEFASARHFRNTTGWLYGASQHYGSNPGIWLGYRIARAYYEQALDKLEAICEMLQIQDYEGFLKKSGYGR